MRVFLNFWCHFIPFLWQFPVLSLFSFFSHNSIIIATNIGRQMAARHDTVVAVFVTCMCYEMVTVRCYTLWCFNIEGQLKWLSLFFSVFLYSNYTNYRGLSFRTISAFGANAAVIHYRPEAETDTTIDNSNVYLLDSGGQYLYVSFLPLSILL